MPPVAGILPAVTVRGERDSPTEARKTSTPSCASLASKHLQPAPRKIWCRTSRTWRSSSTIRTSRCPMSIYLLARTCRHDLVLAGPLRGIERPIGGAEQLLRRGGLVVREAGDAEARGDALAMRVGEGRDDLPYPVRVEPSAALGGLDQQDGELVAAVARDNVDAARVLHEDLTDIAQGLVADRVAELVVDALEPVQVEHHHGYRVIEPPEA